MSVCRSVCLSVQKKIPNYLNVILGKCRLLLLLLKIPSPPHLFLDIIVLGIDLDRIKQFAAEFRSVRISLGLTQTQVGDS